MHACSFGRMVETGSIGNIEPKTASLIGYASHINDKGSVSHIGMRSLVAQSRMSGKLTQSDVKLAEIEKNRPC
ncbi:MAG: hypothetical protein NTY25_01885 [Planctomycetia bacterium]|nr:hypothetical protein [Planctomycetia bacterium]